MGWIVLYTGDKDSCAAVAAQLTKAGFAPTVHPNAGRFDVPGKERFTAVTVDYKEWKAAKTILEKQGLKCLG